MRNIESTKVSLAYLMTLFKCLYQLHGGGGTVEGLLAKLSKQPVVAKLQVRLDIDRSD